jgi:hypothetical protein
MLRSDTPEGMMNAAKQTNLSNLNVVPGAVLQVIEDHGDHGTWKTVAECLYTPKSINDAMKANGLTSAWVKWTCGRGLWFVGDQLATHS